MLQVKISFERHKLRPNFGSDNLRYDVHSLPCKQDSQSRLKPPMPDGRESSLYQVYKIDTSDYIKRKNISFKCSDKLNI
jgi:hypothetical protein